VDVDIQLNNLNAHAAGTGIVLDSSGVVLTNNHVISDASSITATDIGDGHSYPVTVVGYDRAHDIAVLQLQGASDLPTAVIGNSGAVAVGDRIAAIGNAGGRGGTPSIVAGTVSALNQAAAVSDDITGSVEHLTGLIEMAADIQPGDSGGPLVNAAGEVIGVDTAGTTGSRAAPTGAGLAIPINDAITISKQIQAGTASDTIHIGATGVLGILAQDNGGPGRHARLAHRHSGVAVAGVVAGSPAEQSGLTAGDIVVSFDGTAVDSTDALITALTAHHPADSVQVAWVDRSGQQHSATVTLAPGPPN
jgi:S1-C subfamily serine protease